MPGASATWPAGSRPSRRRSTATRSWPEPSRRRCRELGLPGDAIDLLTLLDAEVEPVEMLRLSDDELRGLVGRMERELGES